MKRLIPTLSTLFLLSSIIGGCNLPTALEAMPVVENTVAVVSLTDTPEMPADDPIPTETDVPEITHVMKPTYGDGKAQTIHDQVSDKTAPEKRAYGGDEFANGRYERPFLAENMEYLPYIDIVRTDMYRDEDDVWAYVTIEVVNSPSYAGEKELHYAIELDENLDGRGDMIILVNTPENNKWTTAGVQIWQDINASIGDKTPIRPDVEGSSDGYEMMIFDEGIGEDADLAWVRKSDESNEKIEIAFKLNLVPIEDEAHIFLWGAWAFVGDPHLDWFDHNDSLSLEEAGSPIIEDDNYPLNQFEAADNTCRGLSGAVPSGNLPGMCPYKPPTTSGGTPPEGCVEINCCPNGSSGCPFVWDAVLCECVEVIPELY
ncbi:MAG: hypothetical protein JEZ00_19305 [Anaerolineaceae bacterium]|nr:hypothetical protein [Anaerolineaceae bacterium]